MPDNQITQSNQNQTNEPPHPNILNMTLGELMNHNPTAQNMVMQSTKVSPEQLQQLLNLTGNNQMMHMTIGDLFKNGTIAQATQFSPLKFQQITGLANNQLPIPPTSLQQSAPKPSLLQKLKNLFQ